VQPDASLTALDHDGREGDLGVPRPPSLPLVVGYDLLLPRSACVVAAVMVASMSQWLWCAPPGIHALRRLGFGGGHADPVVAAIRGERSARRTPFLTGPLLPLRHPGTGAME